MKNDSIEQNNYPKKLQMRHNHTFVFTQLCLKGLFSLLQFVSQLGKGGNIIRQRTARLLVGKATFLDFRVTEQLSPNPPSTDFG